jgi:hypothetical protein
VRVIEAAHESKRTGKAAKPEPFFVEKRADEGKKQKLPAVKTPKKWCARLGLQEAKPRAL